MARPADAARSETKICISCGRSFGWRKAWARDWPQVRYCSRGCRQHRPSPEDRALERCILELLARRARGASICPSEAARAHRPEDWRPLMEPVRRAARRLVASGELEILQRGRVVTDPSRTRGPLRLRLAEPDHTRSPT